LEHGKRMGSEHKRLTLALLLSLLIHASLLSLTFGGDGLGLPAFGFPWDRRIEAPDMRVVVVPPQATEAEPAATPGAEPSQRSPVEPPLGRGPSLTPSVAHAPTPPRTAAANAPEAAAAVEPNSATDANSRTDAATSGTPSQALLRDERPGDTAPPPISPPAVIAMPRTDEATWVVPAAPEMLAQEASERSVEPAKPEAIKQERQRQAEQLEATRQEAVRAENARLEAERREAARKAADLQEAARQEAERKTERKETERKEAALQEAARSEAARVEAARVEAARVEVARVEAARVEAARVEAARVEAARVEAARVEAARVEAARVEAARVEAARAEAARAEAARIEAEQAESARREAARRAIGRQLDEEAARRDAAARLPPSWNPARRYRLFGRTDPNAELILWAEAWARKIELNLTFDIVREAAKQPHRDPVVTVAIRSDGSVESVTFVLSSGVPALDEAIRRVVHSQTPYQVFPPGLASEYDVIEVRRTWYFDVAIRLY